MHIMNNSGNLCYSDEGGQNCAPEFPQFVYVIFGTVGIITIVLTFSGNVLTILSYIRDVRLHSVYNTYILNLAIADFILGFLVLPIYLAYETSLNSQWLGYYLCKIFLVIDFTVCVEGVCMMVIISYDRLMLIRHGVSYNQRETKTKCNLLILCSWIFSFLLYGPSIVFWDLWSGRDINSPGICDVQFAYHSVFTTVTAICEFFVPLILLSIVNTCIITELRKRSKLKITMIIRRSLRYSIKSLPTAGVTSSGTVGRTEEKGTQTELMNKKDKDIKTRQKNKRKKRERKAMKSLGLLMIVFLITWAPYTIYTIIKAVRGGDIELLSYEALTWFLWMKSAVNPFLYAFNSKRYRRNFKHFLCLICS